MSITYSVCPQCKKINKIDSDQVESKSPTCGACQTPLDFSDGVTNLNGEQVIQLIKSSPIPVVIDFWAPWCGPCRMFAPIFSSTAKSLMGRYVFVKVNTDESPGVGQAFGVRGIPTVAVFKNGEELDRQSGVLPQDEFVNWLASSASE